MGNPETSEVNQRGDKLSVEFQNVLLDSINNRWDELLERLQSEIPSEISNAQETGTLDEDRKGRYRNILEGIKTKLGSDRVGDFSTKYMILDLIVKLKKNLK